MKAALLKSRVTAVVTLDLGRDVVPNMPGVQKWIDILESRLSWIQSALFCIDVEASVPGDLTKNLEGGITAFAVDPDYSYLLELQTLVNTALTSASSEHTPKTDVVEQMAVYAKTHECFLESWAGVLFASIGFNGDKFTVDVCLTTSSKLLEEFRVMRAAFLLHEMFASQ